MPQMIYNSPNYCVVEFADDNGRQGGFEIMDKHARRETFIGGAMAINFRQHVAALIEAEPTIEEVDDFLSGFDGLMQQPVCLH